MPCWRVERPSGLPCRSRTCSCRSPSPGWSGKRPFAPGNRLVGVSPLDELEDSTAASIGLPEWRQIALRNEAHIRGCVGVIANLTPFRGPSADVGTVYEIGFARGLGLKVFGYATMTTSFLERTLSLASGQQNGDGSWRDADGLLIEQFGLFDNLMIEGGLVDSGGGLILGDQDRWNDLSVFERCVQAASRILGAVA